MSKSESQKCNIRSWEFTKYRYLHAPKEKIQAGKKEGNFIKCCTNTPTLGGKSEKATKYCWEHLHLEDKDCGVDSAESREKVSEEEVVKEAYVYPISAREIDQKFVGDIPEHDGLECEQGGC